jgi:nitrite reductase/ring-hydroxylating ferredoxin subunit/Fe-S cluster biogenesis protein NfuA
MTEQQFTVQTSQEALSSFVERIEALEAIVDGWDDSHRLTVQALRGALEALHKEAFRRLILGLKVDPSAAQALRGVVSDEVVYAVLRHFDLVKPSLNERIEEALASVRPLLEGHGGNVELVRVVSPNVIEVRLLGACDGCAASELTLTEGIEKAIRQHCPEITTIQKTKGAVSAVKRDAPLVSFVSPFTKNTDADWQPAADLDDIPDGGVKAVECAGHALLLSRQDRLVTCFENACAHMGKRLDRGIVIEGIITCPYHGFQYDLSSGECLTAPQVQLISKPVRVTGTTVEVRAYGKS